MIPSESSSEELKTKENINMNIVLLLAMDSRG